MSRRIRLTDEAVERLDACRREDETYSEVVLRLTDRPSLLDLAGILFEDAADDLESRISERRDRRRETLERRF